jgi:hypothetical protein
MNERIQEFKIECLEWNEEDQVWQVNAEKFAELIAWECIDLSLGSSHRDDDMGAIIANKIKQHFGVEE